MSLFRISPDKKRLSIYQKEDFLSKYRESDLQDWLEIHPEAILEEEPLLIIGREVLTDTGHPMDLLGIDRNGYPVIVELKATRTPRYVISQVLDYSSWVGTLSDEELITVADSYISQETSYADFKEAFNDTFADHGDDLLNKLRENGHFNSKRRLVIVAQGVDLRTRRMAKELDANGYIVTLRSYSYYVSEQQEFLNFETVFSSISPSIKLGGSIQMLRHKTLKQKGSVEIFDHLHGLLSDREDLLVEVGSHGAIYKINIDNKLKSLANLYPMRKDVVLGGYVYLHNIKEKVDVELLLDDISKVVGMSKLAVRTPAGDASFEIKTKEQADEVYNLINDLLREL